MEFRVHDSSPLAIDFAVAVCRLLAGRVRRLLSTALERVRVRFLLDRHPLPLGEFFPIGGTADAGTVAGRAGAAERDVRLVGDGLVVDMKEPGVEPIADRDGAPDV